jgi:hypothetical protein
MSSFTHVITIDTIDHYTHVFHSIDDYRSILMIHIMLYILIDHCSKHCLRRIKYDYFSSKHPIFFYKKTKMMIFQYFNSMMDSLRIIKSNKTRLCTCHIVIILPKASLQGRYIKHFYLIILTTKNNHL